MAEQGGASTQDGIYYQNTVAARYLADLLDLGVLPPREQVREVRVEAPSDVDDIVVLYADGHRAWIQAKVRVQSSGDAWDGLWSDLATQASKQEFGLDDRLVIIFGDHDAVATGLRDLCERASTAQNNAEWRGRLGERHRRILSAVERALGSSIDSLELLRRTVVEISPLEEIERAFERKRLGGAFTLPVRFITVLRDLAGGGARRRALFLAAPLRRRLANDFSIDVAEPAEWGLPVYRATVDRLARIEIPGTGISGPVLELFVWPRADEYDRTAAADFEDENPNWASDRDNSDVDLEAFPSDRLDRAIVVAGPGHGKSVLLKAVAARLARGPLVPAIIPLASLSASELGVVEFLTTVLNREFSVRVDWLRLCDHGLAVLLFDGLDEMPAGPRRVLLNRIATFSARHPRVPWLLTVRDPAALSGSPDARIVELLPLRSEDVVRFADVMKSRVRGLDGWSFVNDLEAYPDLVRLARIPLFLTLLLASWSPERTLPKTRADLIESYLKTLFSPHEHKPHVLQEGAVPALRPVTEFLAFTRLEHQEIGATEREVLDVASRVSADIGAAETILGRLIACGMLRRQSAIRLEFPYPIVQEYLAACYLVKEHAEELVYRINDAIQRPWAQVLQFALELHQEPSPLMREMLARGDDAFATGLRLVGRCIANGARVEQDLKVEVGERLAAFWEQSPWRIRVRVGRLIVDGFSTPLLPKVRTRLGKRWLIESGAGEIVTAANDQALTHEVLAALLKDQLDRFMGMRTLQPALDRMGDEALRMYFERARQAGTTSEELAGLADLVGALDPGRLTPGLNLSLALDESLPDELRLAAFRVGSGFLDNRAWPLIHRALLSDYYGDHWAAIEALARAANLEEAVLDQFRDLELTETRRREIAARLKILFPEVKTRVAFIRRCMNEETLSPLFRDMMMVYAARYGDQSAFESVVERLGTLELNLASATISLFGHYRLLNLALRAADLVRARVNDGVEAARFAHSGVTGMTTIYEMDWFDGGILKPCPPHPALEVWAELVDSWSTRSDLTFVQHMNVLRASSDLGSERAVAELERMLISAPSADDPIFDEEDEDGHYLRAAVDQVRWKRRRLPLDLAERLARAARPNVPYAGIAAIASHADREALDLLLKLHGDPALRGINDTVTETIESVASRLGVTVRSIGGVLRAA